MQLQYNVLLLCQFSEKSKDRENALMTEWN